LLSVTETNRHTHSLWVFLLIPQYTNYLRQVQEIWGRECQRELHIAHAHSSPRHQRIYTALIIRSTGTTGGTAVPGGALTTPYRSYPEHVPGVQDAGATPGGGGMIRGV